jgi:predicted glycogen debranching enzyme
MTIPTSEWMETDGLGGFASGTSTGPRTRRYHGVLLAATTPPTGRVMLVNGLEAWVETPTGRYAISSQRYAPDVVHPDGIERLTTFANDPWPRWTYRLEDGTVIEHELVVQHGAPVTALSWRLVNPRADVRLSVRPLLSGRDYHATHIENASFRFEAFTAGQLVTWRPYDGLPPITVVTNGLYSAQREWYRNFQYDEERTRGLDHLEDLASPGVFAFDLSLGAAAMVLTTATTDGTARSQATDSTDKTDPSRVPDNTGYRDRAAFIVEQVFAGERRRRTFPSVLHRAADSYLVRRGEGKTIVAGYPWFTDWGRDTFISIRGLCISTGRLDEARDILLAWSGSVSEGMLPNRFLDHGAAPEYTSVDASLWYAIAVHDFLAASIKRGFQVTASQQDALRSAVDAILDGYASGTRYGIRADADGLLACGSPGIQLTWMDAKVGDWVVTPRSGKPVEIQALWLNALWVAGHWTNRWKATLAAGTAVFRARFWNGAEGCLFDVVDVDHEPGRVDPTFRPNQILAIGGLPLSLLDGPSARRVVDAVESRLLTPMGLRSLAPGSPGYAPRYEGNGAERDARYHQGTVWPWLIGPFVEAWLRVRASTDRNRDEARARFLQPLLQLAARNGGQLPEIADAEAPHMPRGCPCQAWSVAEVLRLESLMNPKSQ